MRDTLCLSCFQAKDLSFRASSSTPPNTSPREFPDAFTPPGSPKSSQPATYPGDDKDTILSLGGKILGQAMLELSENYIKFQEKHTDQHWRLESFSGRNSFGALTFGHELYKGEQNNYTPPKKDVVRTSDTIFKIFWLNTPTEVFVGQGMRNLRLGFETERQVLLLAKEAFEDAVNPCPKYYRCGTKTIIIKEEDPFENTTKTVEGEVGWIEMERLEPVKNPEKSLIDVVTQLHKLGYTHNDLSADNVMQRKNRLVLIDLEKAKPLTEDERVMDLNVANKLQVEIEETTKQLPFEMRKLNLEEA